MLMKSKDRRKYHAIVSQQVRATLAARHLTLPTSRQSLTMPFSLFFLQNQKAEKKALLTKRRKEHDAAKANNGAQAAKKAKK